VDALTYVNFAGEIYNILFYDSGNFNDLFENHASYILSCSSLVGAKARKYRRYYRRIIMSLSHKTNITMKITLALVCALCLLPLFFAEEVNDDKAIVQAGNQKWMEIFNSGNALRLVECYVKDAVLVTPGGSSFVRGSKAIAETFDSLYKAKKFTHVTLTSLDIQRVNGTLIAELGQYKNQANATGSYYVVWGRQNDGNWVIQTDTMIN
jgi:ketosteroid isomerase-like protein